MALADSVPGVSGGTIAFILGFYDDFIGSLSSLTSTKSSKEDKKKALFFLIKLGFGWIIGFVLSVLILSSIFDKHIYSISSLFTGFIIVSIPLIMKQEKESLTGKYKNIIFTLIGAIVVVLISSFNPSGSTGVMNLSLNNLGFGLGLFVFIAGMIAISAMVLPGISGSTLLLIFGLYTGIVRSIKEVVSLNFSYLPVLIIFGLGVIIGILSTIKLIKFLLNKYRSAMIYLILGLMIGSIYAVFMGPTTLEVPQPAMNLSSFNWIFFIIGGALIVILEKSKDLLEKKSK
jgi:putative membrane protein